MGKNKDRDFTAYWRYLENDLDPTDLHPDKEDVVVLDELRKYLSPTAKSNRSNLALDLITRMKALSGLYASGRISQMADGVIENRRAIERDFGDNAHTIISLLSKLYIYNEDDTRINNIWNRDITKQ